MVRAGRYLNLLLVALLLMGSLPTSGMPALASPAARKPTGSSTASPAQQFSKPSTPIQSAGLAAEPRMRLFLPLVRAAIPPLASETRRLLPGVGGVFSLLGGRVGTTISGVALSEAMIVTVAAHVPPTISAPGLGVSGPAIRLDLQADDGSDISRIPPVVTPHPLNPDFPATATVTPSIVLELRYAASDSWGLDPRTLALYTRDDASGTWRRVPSAVYPERRTIVAHVEHSGEYVPMGRLSSTGPNQSAFRLALDPDNDDGKVFQPGVGQVGELAYNIRLAEGVKQRFATAGCLVDVLITRDATTANLDPALRAASINGFGAQVATTLAFNTYQGVPWGNAGNGGPLAWARAGKSDDGALAQSLLDEVLLATGRRSTQPVRTRGGPLTYPAFDSLPATYAHLETLFLDHVIDWVLINGSFDAVIDGVYGGLAVELGKQGVLCAAPGGGFRPPPLPDRPSADQIQRWRDLGMQAYQRYGMDPVSFSTGNHILQLALARIPGRGGLDLDLTLSYNSQDQRGDILGHGWTFPYNIRLQRYADESVSVVLADGRTYHYNWNGSAYIPPPGVYDSLARDEESWTLTSRDREQRWRFQETITGLGVLAEWQDRRGNTLTFTHDLNAQDAWKTGGTVPRPPLKTITDATGRSIGVETDAQGRITGFVLPDTRRFDFTYDPRGDLVSITDANTPVRGTHRYQYDERHRIVEQRDPENILFLTNTYDDRDRVTKQLDASGTPSYAEYNPLAGTTVFTDNLGFRYVYAYDELFRVTAETDPLPRTIRSVYDPSYNVKQTEDGRGKITFYDYDEQGNLIERRDPLPITTDACRPVTYGHDVTSWTYRSDNLVESMTDALGNVWRYEYDDEGNLKRLIAPIGETSATYDEWGQLETFTDANQHTTSYKYDPHGNLKETVNHLQGVSSSTHDITGRELSYTDTNGHTVFFTYNGNDQIVRLTDPKQRDTIFRYNLNDLLLSSTDRVGTTREFRYDDNLKLIAERDHAGGAWQTYAYDDLYRRTSTTDRLGYTTGYDYDSAGQLTALREPNGAITTYRYDADGNLSQVTDALGGATVMGYDAPGRLAASTDAAGSEVVYCYDAEDRLVQTVGPRAGEIYSYEYDALGRLVRVTDPQGNVHGFAHDPVGNRTAEITPLGDRTDFRYDELDRLIAVERPTLPDSARPTTRFGYDKVGNTTVITSPRGFATLLDYDENDNLALFIDPLGARTSYTYDAEDRPLTLTDANGNVTTTAYDSVG